MTLVFELTAKVIGVAVSRAMFVNVTVLVSMCVIAYIYMAVRRRRRSFFSYCTAMSAGVAVCRCKRSANKRVEAQIDNKHL